jgi:hypothetical protein
VDRPDRSTENNKATYQLTAKSPPLAFSRIPGVVEPVTPSRGSQFAVACKDLPEGELVDGGWMTKDPYMLEEPVAKLVSVQKVEYVRKAEPVTVHQKAGKVFDTLQKFMDPVSLAVSVVGMTAQAIQGQDPNPFKVEEEEDEVLYVVYSAAFETPADMQPGTYTAFIWTVGQEKTRCVADIHVK